MKFVTFSFLAAAALASATTITVICPTAGGSGASGTVTSTCNTVAGPSGSGLTLDSLVLTFKFDANSELSLGSVSESFDAASGGFQIGDNWSSGAGSFNSTAFGYQVDVDYTATGPASPEPATLGLTGGALLRLFSLARGKA